MAHSSSLKNHIPSGRQIPRTPPLKDTNPFDVGEKRHLQVGLLNNDELDVKTEPEWSMLKDMKGYQMTADDLDFITKFRSEQRVTKLKVKIQELMRDLSNLKSELAQEQEMNKSNKKLLRTKEAQSEDDKSKRRGRKKAEPGTSKNTRMTEEETAKQEETVPAVRGRRKAVAPVEEPTGLRRSKRIASRK